MRKKKRVPKVNKQKIKSFDESKVASLNKIKVLILLIILLFVVLYIAAAYSPVFIVKNIEVSNNTRLTSEKIIELSRIEQDSNIFRLNKSSIISSLKTNAYIETASIDYKLPTTVKIVVTERKPLFIIQIADSFVYVDRQGYMLEVSTERLDLPIVTGFTTDLNNAKAGDRLSKTDLDKLNRVIKIMDALKTKELLVTVSKIDVSDLNNCSVGFDSEGKVAYLGNCSDIDIRMDYLKTILEQESGHTGLIFVDMDLTKGKAFFREE